jgi:DNA-directed RNA polymerase sigma subunit (sigma70/sigma32)
MSKEHIERNEVIDKLRTEGKTLQQIGDIFNISRQRVMQVINRNTLDKKDEQE